MSGQTAERAQAATDTLLEQASIRIRELIEQVSRLSAENAELREALAEALL